MLYRGGLEAAVGAIVALSLWGCVSRPVEAIRTEAGSSRWVFPQSADQAVDILFVIDDSGSMAGEQRSLAKRFPQLVDALRNYKLGAVDERATCKREDESGCRIPDIHIGVVSTDLGAGPHEGMGCSGGGEEGILQSHVMAVGCVEPDDPWIAYRPDGNETNIRSQDSDPIAQVAQTFSCMAQLGAGGCGFEQPLEAARRALDPALGLNPGFLRRGALLAVVFITDEDDCSTDVTDLFEMDDTRFGPASWRCFEVGVQCDNDGEDRRAVGERVGCRAESSYLTPVAIDQGEAAGGFSYERFFRQLKVTGAGEPIPGRLILAAIAGPTSPVRVGRDDRGEPRLEPSCTYTEPAEIGTSATSGRAEGDTTSAKPAIRLQTLLNSFQREAGDVPGIFSSICPDDATDDNFGRSLAMIGERISTTRPPQCLSSPVLTLEGGLACVGGDVLDREGRLRCAGVGCMDRADCVVEDGLLEGGPRQAVPRCSPEVFHDRSIGSCTGGACPCWRIVADSHCTVAKHGSPHALEILRAPNTSAPVGTYAHVQCARPVYPWASAELLTSLDEDGNGTIDRVCN